MRLSYMALWFLNVATAERFVFDDFYTENFFGLNSENQVRYAILSLKCAGFLPKVDFQMQHLDLKIPYLG
mgnify:CR=1 FL=1